MNIQFIAKQHAHVDHNYGTGEWEPEQIKDVPEEIGRKMISHADVYALAKKAPKADVEKVVINHAPEIEAQDINDQISIMDKKQAADFIERNFNQKVDMRSFKTEESIRAHARMLYNQFGVA